MAEQQKCKKLASVLVEHQDHFGVMPDDDCQWAIQHPKEAVVLFAVAVNNLLDYANDPAIITFLGGESKVEISLGQFFAAFAKQPSGEAGALLTNGYANIGYIRDINGVLWAVVGGLGGRGWYFGARPLGGPLGWLSPS